MPESSAIHAFDVSEVVRDGETWVRFSIHPWQRSSEDSAGRGAAAGPAGGAAPRPRGRRYVVEMDVTLMGRTLTTEMTLSNRDQMGFRLLIGRQALRQGFVVDSARSYSVAARSGRSGGGTRALTGTRGSGQRVKQRVRDSDSPTTTAGTPTSARLQSSSKVIRCRHPDGPRDHGSRRRARRRRGRRRGRPARTKLTSVPITSTTTHMIVRSSAAAGRFG